MLSLSPADEHAVQSGQGLLGRLAGEARIERRFPHPDPEPIQLGDGLGKQGVLGGGAGGQLGGSSRLGVPGLVDVVTSVSWTT